MIARLLFGLLLVFTAHSTALAQQKAADITRPEPAINSLYTSLTKCKLIYFRQEGGGQSIQNCPGVAGYALRLEDADIRMSVTVVDPRGKRYPLDFYEVVSTHPSEVGKKAEWRVIKDKQKITPVALIVRLDVTEEPETGKRTSYLIVSKITKDEICVTDKIPPGPDANLEARRAADASAGKPCLKRPEESRQGTQ